MLLRRLPVAGARYADDTRDALRMLALQEHEDPPPANPRAYLAGAAVDLGHDIGELDGDVGGVAIQHRRVSAVDLPRVVEHDDLRLEIFAALGGVILGVAAHVAALDILDRQPLDVKACLACDGSGLRGSGSGWRVQVSYD